MKIKKKIDVEIETESLKVANCSTKCIFLYSLRNPCVCRYFSVEVRNLKRCQQCIEAFGMGEE